MLEASSFAPRASSMSTTCRSPRPAAHINGVKSSQLRPFGSAPRTSAPFTAAGSRLVIAMNSSALRRSVRLDKLATLALFGFGCMGDCAMALMPALTRSESARQRDRIVASDSFRAESWFVYVYGDRCRYDDLCARSWEDYSRRTGVGLSRSPQRRRHICHT